MNTSTLHIPGFTIGYQTWGKPTNPAILALHGWLDNASSFNLLAPILSERFYLVAIDLPGHGLSSHLPAGCQYHFIDGIFTLLQILDQLELKKVHLLGHSMGACLASLIAGVVPERFLSLSMIEAIGPFSSEEDTCCQQMRKYAQQLLVNNAERQRAYPSLEAAALARANSGYLALEHAKILCERGLRQEKNHFYWRHDRRLLSPTPLRMTEGQILSCLQAITAKSCLILAKQGFNFEEQALKGRINSVKQLQVSYFEGGHHLHMEQPETIGQYLLEFMH